MSVPQHMLNLPPYGLVLASVMSPCLALSVFVTAVGIITVATPGLAQSSPPTATEAEADREQPPSRPVETATVTTPSGDRLTVRSGPGASYGVIDSLANGQTLQLSGLTLGNWAQLLGGGWVYLPYLQISEGAAGAN